jgi:hypothetical protein
MHPASSIRLPHLIEMEKLERAPQPVVSQVLHDSEWTECVDSIPIAADKLIDGKWVYCRCAKQAGVFQPVQVRPR